MSNKQKLLPLMVDELINTEWHLLDQPWCSSRDSGMSILSGDCDPHISTPIADTRDCFGDYYSDDVARCLASHIVEIHNNWLDSQLSRTRTDTSQQQEKQQLEYDVKALTILAESRKEQLKLDAEKIRKLEQQLRSKGSE